MADIAKPKRPWEAIYVEGNTLELALFCLSPKDVPLARVKQVDLGVTDQATGASGAVTIRSSGELGFPSMFDDCVLGALLELAQNAGPDAWITQRKLYVSRIDICRTMGIPHPTGTDFDNIEKACQRLAGTLYTFHSSWWNAKTGRRVSTKDNQTLLSRVTFVDERGKSPRQLALLPTDRLAVVEKDGKNQRSSIEFGELLADSIQAGYTVKISTRYKATLVRRQQALAARLYSYLSKKDGTPRGEGADRIYKHEEDIFLLALHLGLSKRQFRAFVVEKLGDHKAFLEAERLSSQSACKRPVEAKRKPGRPGRCNCEHCEAVRGARDGAGALGELAREIEVEEADGRTGFRRFVEKWEYAYAADALKADGTLKEGAKPNKLVVYFFRDEADQRRDKGAHGIELVRAALLKTDKVWARPDKDTGERLPFSGKKETEGAT